MRRRWMQSLAFILASVMFFVTPLGTYATTTIDSLNQKINEDAGAIKDAQKDKEELESGLDAIQEKKEQLEQEKTELTSYVVQLDGEMNQVLGDLAQVESLLAKKTEEIEQTKKDLEQAKNDVDNQYENMKIRIKFMYEHGSVSSLQILLGAGSFSEMLNKAQYIEELSNYDREMLVKFTETKEKVEKLEEELKSQQQVLEATKAEVQDKQKEMAGLIQEKKEEITDYETNIENKEKAIAEYEQMIKEQDATIKALEASVAAAKAQRDKLSVSENSAGTMTYGGGPFAFPAPSYTRVSDDYGNRIHPILGVQQFHNGIDFAAPSGSPILAAADGVVIAASYSATMGNYIMIDHGSQLYTIYMHASALYVSTGSKVTKGSQIAAVGSTGRSTGPHLHFSVRLNGSYVSPWNYL